MQISEVAQKTGLTKKAIEYYCEQGLIQPEKLANGYRQFSEVEEQQLQKISLYRQLGLSVKEIAQVLVDPSLVQKIAYQKEQQLKIAQAQQDLLKAIGAGKAVTDLALNIRQLSAKESIGEKLLRMFPSYFGKLINSQFAYYLKEPIKTPEQQAAFHDIVVFLDQGPQLKLSSSLETYLDEMTAFVTAENTEELVANKEQSMENYPEFISENRQTIEQYIAYKNSDAYRSSPWAEITEIMKSFCQTSGYYEIFIPALRKLSPTYDRYYQKLLLANECLLQDFPEVAKW